MSETFDATVYCTTSFIGYHRWPNAPRDVAFLRDRHRHRFNVLVEVGVNHDDRDVEFISLKRQVDTHVHKLLGEFDDDQWSCEEFARKLATRLKKHAGRDVRRVEVSEDGENGAIVRR
jgi:6-pyruvoyl-tetrahydropterin synthase